MQLITLTTDFGTADWFVGTTKGVILSIAPRAKMVDITQAEWVKKLKRVSNPWLKERGREYADFEWQGGYADFSVSQSNLERMQQYIGSQEEHHRKMSFQDELRALLRKHEVEWDEKYVWD